MQTVSKNHDTRTDTNNVLAEVGSRRMAFVKSKKDIDELYGDKYNGEGWHLRGQFFGEEKLQFSGKLFEFEKQWLYCWAAKIENTWLFFPEDALVFVDEQYYNDRFELWLKRNYQNVNDESAKNTLREIFNAMDDEDK